MNVSTNNEQYLTELQDLCNLFGYDNEKTIEHTEQRSGSKIHDHFVYKEHGQMREYDFDYSLPANIDAIQEKSIRKRMVKNHLYVILSKELGKTLPWGSLTGVRPTKFARDLVERGEIKEHLIAETLEKEYFVRKDKAKLVTSIIKNQKGIIRNDNVVDFYVNIPICPSRCSYCSFISSEIGAVKDKVEKYIDCLIKEIDAVKTIIKNKALLIRNIYIGGGTPSVLSAKQLERLLDEINFPANEFTVECGRADTITEEKLDVLKEHGVTRISINPQTFCQTTLNRIGRKHKNSDILSAYSMAIQKGFIVNMDIIAGLPGEKLATFKRTMKSLLEYYPHNLTVHTLSVKNGAILKENQQDISSCNEDEVMKMVDYAQKLLSESEYKPYYLYRQKNQLCGLENVGYFRDDSACMFNIDSMEEFNTIIGVGANAISKRVFNIEKHIERLPNVKFIEDYIQRIDEMIEKKKIFFK